MDKSFYRNNRDRFISELEDDSIAILIAGSAPKKTADEKYMFTPNRNFLYLTGVDEEDHILIISKMKGVHKSILFIKDIDEKMEKWNGRTLREEEALEISGVDDIKYLSQLEDWLDRIISSNEFVKVYMDLEDNREYTGEFIDKLETDYLDITIYDLNDILGSLRMIKSNEEILNIQKAIDITIEGVKALMSNSHKCTKEYQLEAYFDFVCKSNGIKDYAFKTIAASGKNAAVLHYVDNNSTLRDNELILFDLGAQYNYYNGDISRTFPVNGKFTERQKEVYNAVLRVNEAVIKLMVPGVNFLELNKVARNLIADECIKLGLITNQEDVGKYYYHSIGHSLGMDTHDYEPEGRNVELRAGMIYTVEPGIYIEEEAIGIRIEDDILITEDGNIVLTSKMIKTVEEIEKFMKNNKKDLQ